MFVWNDVFVAVQCNLPACISNLPAVHIRVDGGLYLIIIFIMIILIIAIITIIIRTIAIAIITIPEHTSVFVVTLSCAPTDLRSGHKVRGKDGKDDPHRNLV